MENKTQHTYLSSGPPDYLYTVGFYGPGEKWYPLEDFVSESAAIEKAQALNGESALLAENQRKLEAFDAMLAALKALSIDSFGDDMSKCDAADFVDHAGEFFEAMLLARAAIKLAEGK
jgi:hypothetical protein